MKKTLVIDTSVFVSALLSENGDSRQILRYCLKRKYQPLMGTGLFSEYESLLHREYLYRKCILTAKERESLLNAFLAVCRWVHVYYLWRPNLTDKGDNHILELAVAGNAEGIITHNLKGFKGGQLMFPDVAIVTPRQLLLEENKQNVYVND